MTWLEITLWSIPASIPAAMLWRWRVNRARARMIAEMMEYRRAKFGGSIKLPGQKTVTRLDPP